MKQTDRFLERIRQAELKEFNRSSSFSSDMTLKTTAEVAGDNEVEENVDEKTFKPDSYTRYIYLVVSFVSMFWIVETFLNNNSKTTRSADDYMVPVFLFSVAIWEFFFVKPLNTTIHLDKRGIRIDETLFEWDEIYETAILTEPAGNGKRKYLVIASNDMTNYARFDLEPFFSFNFLGFTSKLSMYIEYFRTIRK